MGVGLNDPSDVGRCPISEMEGQNDSTDLGRVGCLQSPTAAPTFPGIMGNGGLKKLVRG